MRKLPALMALMLIGAAAAPAYAQEPPTAPEAVEGLAPMAADDLQAVSGQGVEAILLSEQQLAATSSGNSVTATTIRSGDVNFSGSALTGFSGVGNFVVNTGNNNNLQGAISVNIITTPAP